MPDQNDQFAAEQFYDKLHAQEVTPVNPIEYKEEGNIEFCLSAQWMKIVSEFLKAEKNDDFPEEPVKMAMCLAKHADKAIMKSVDYQIMNDPVKQEIKEAIYKTAATCLRMLKELNKTD